MLMSNTVYQYKKLKANTIFLSGLAIKLAVRCIKSHALRFMCLCESLSLPNRSIVVFLKMKYICVYVQGMHTIEDVMLGLVSCIGLS